MYKITLHKLLVNNIFMISSRFQYEHIDELVTEHDDQVLVIKLLTFSCNRRLKPLTSSFAVSN